MTSNTQEPASLQVPIQRREKGPFHIKIRLGENAPIGVLLDTGSTGIVIGHEHLPSSAVKMDPQPPYKVGYSSSDKAYAGAWYSVNVTIPGVGGCAVTNQLPIFSATSHPGVAMCGVGVQGDKPATFNPFLSIDSITLKGSPNTFVTQGYVLSKDGITLGLSEEIVSQFPTMVPMDDFKATVHLKPTGTVGGALYHFKAPALIDSGIGYMILNPSLRSVTDAPPGFCNKETGHFLDGTSIKFDGGISYDFTVGDHEGNPPMAADYVRWGTSKKGRIINTGRNVLMAYEMLIHPGNNRFGFRKIAAD
ncbi:hypothetical protein ACFO5Q_18845 [Kordiimonas lipolytica]|uniref:Acid protease n=1 Tax=Kordiimonas lipolytica TaxID=1662421 RepID=A0ABV8UH35_9PROT|nr:hypothetical protein [Kordiimonas lipolytica]